MSDGLAMLQPMERRRSVDQIVEQLEHFILNQNLQIGDAVPSERELAGALGVSRTIVRGAISMLVQKGLLEVRPGDGTYVARPSIDFLRDSLHFLVHLDPSALLDLVEVRLLLEVETAGLAAERVTDHDRELITAAERRIAASSHDFNLFAEADLQFHVLLAQIARNPVLATVLNSIREAMRENIIILTHRFTQEHIDETIAYHERIANAVRSGDAPVARQAMREHLSDVRQGLQELDPEPEVASTEQ